MISWSIWTSYQRGELANSVFLLLWLLFPIIAIIAVSYKYPIFQSKQLVIVLIPLCIVLAAVSLELPRLIRWVVTVMATFFILSSLKTLYTVNTKHEWREAGTYIDAHCKTGDALYLNPAAGIFTLETYLGQSIPHDGYPLDYDIVKGGWKGKVVTANIAEQAIDQLASQYSRVWLVEFGPWFWDPEGNLAARIEYHGRLVEDQSFRGVHVRLYDLTQGGNP